MFRAAKRTDSGFSLIDMLVVITLIGIVSGIAIPTLINSINGMRLGQSSREVERELQTAKQRAVGKGRPMRVRFNCPTAADYRIVEIIGSPAVPVAADNAADRCSETVYPHPPDNNPLTRPNLDGPIRRLDREVTFAVQQTVEFWPDGTAHYNNGGVNPWPMIPTAGISIQLTRAGRTTTITVNGLGKILLVQ
jgi:prepilin-type N-terminal cleavage/methylation domain-containing protein